MFDLWKRFSGSGDAGKEEDALPGVPIRDMGGEVREHLRFHGRVQGVGFRFTASYIAKRLFLTGWVRNCEDGTVEAELQGREQGIAEFLQEIQGQPYIMIDDVERARIPLQADEKGFRVTGRF